MPSPRWLRLLSENIGANKAPTYTLATVEMSSSENVSHEEVIATARARSVIHRQILNIAPSKDLLITTTDIRSPKASQLVSNSHSEATFWFPESQTQFRITARTRLVPEPNHPLRKEISSTMASGNQDFDWEGHRLNVYDSLSPYLRASFVRPPPGTRMKSYDEANQWPQKLPKRHEAEGQDKQYVIEALKNFAIVILEPVHVDLVELAIYPNRRTAWSLNSDTNAWIEEILVP